MPSPIEKLQKFFKLETERGFDNRAVVGGLDKIIPIWEQESRASRYPTEIIQLVSHDLQQYPSLAPEERKTLIQKILQSLSDIPLVEAAQPQPAPKGVASDLSKAADARVERTSLATRSRTLNSTLPSRTSVPAVPGLGLNSPLTVIPGIGPQSAKTLATLNLKVLDDLLHYYPRRYDDYSHMNPINRLEYGQDVTVLATLQSINSRPIRGGQSSITEAVVSDGTGFLRLTWFNQPWIATRLTPGTALVLSGKVEMYLGRLVMNSPEWEFMEQDHLHTNRIVPIYSLTARITQKWLRRIMYQTVSYWAPRVTDYLPESIRTAADLIELPTALSQIHFPDSQESLRAAQARLAFDEIFFLQLGVLSQKQSWQSITAETFPVDDEWLSAQISRLPFELTSAQKRVIDQIRADLTSRKPMNRLLQGDVGSGKTVVAALGIAIVTHNGAQAALMAPTSILAEQHFRNLQNLLAGSDTASPLQRSEIRLLIGDTSDSDKREIREGLADGSIKLVIGTHALLEDPITFQRLQMVVIDEQHRFGVEQRSILRSKGTNPHLLVMTATPIPRSLALTVYGDLDVSVMDEMPAGRLPIETQVFPPRERERAYSLVRSQVKYGHQAFFIYPLVEQGEKEDALAAVEKREYLQNEIFPNLRIGLLHGRMKPEEKDRVMSQFRDREYDILVSTSVIEVGVDIPNATAMVIEGANRFGLAQLHQFRGRVGRGPDQSYCILIPDTEDAVENERLAVMAETNDGFVLAERDLEQRGPGDFLGTRQSGFADLRMASLTNIKLIEKAREQAQYLFSIDPDLTDPAHAGIVTMLQKFWGGGKGDIS